MYSRQEGALYKASLLLILSFSPSDVLAVDPVVEFTANYPFIARGTFTAQANISPRPPSTASVVRINHITMDAPRWKNVSRSTGTEIKAGKTITTTLRAETVIPMLGKGVINVGETNQAKNGMSAYIKQLPAKLARESGYGFHSYAVDSRIMGNDYQTLEMILANSDVKTANEQLDKVNVVVLTSTGRWGKHVIWLDPSRNYLPLRLVQVKEANDLADEAVPLRTWVKDADETPARPATRYSQQFDTLSTEKINGRYVITKFARQSVLKYSDQSESVQAEQVTLANIKPVTAWDKDPFVFTVAIPDGTPVTVHDDMPIEYEWRGGKIVKKVNTTAVETVGSAEFKPPQSGNSVNALLITLATFVTAGIGYLIRRRLRAKRGPT